MPARASWKSLCFLAAAQILWMSNFVAEKAFGQEAHAFVAHVGSERSKEAGLAVYKTVSTMIPAGKELHIHEVVGTQGVSFRVRIGPAMTKADATNICTLLSSRGHAFCEPANVFELASVSAGYYGEVLLKPLKDGRNMQVAQPFGFVDSQARKWEVPSGAITDGASIPRVFWSIIGSPFTGNYLQASVIHDYYCSTKNRSWMDTHDVFFESMIASGEAKNNALLMWAAVYRFGPRWLRSESVCWGTCAGDASYVENMEIQPSYSEAEFLKIKEEVKTHPDTTLAELRKFVDERTFDFSEARVRGTVSGGGIDEKTGWPRKQIDEAAPSNWMYFGSSASAVVSNPVFRAFNVKPHDFLNVRSGNGSNFSVVAKIPHDGSGIVILDGCASAWCRVRYNRVEGWVNTSFLTIDWDATKDTRPLNANAGPRPDGGMRFTPDNGAFSVDFPAKPVTKLADRAILHELFHNNAGFVVFTSDDFGCCTYELLEARVTGFFVQGMRGAVTSLRKTKYTKAPGDQLLALEFTIKGDAWVGKGKIVGDGVRAYMMFAYSIGPHDRRAAVEGFLRSFRLKSSNAR